MQMQLKLTGLQISVRTGKLFSYFSTKTYVVGTQKNRLNFKGSSFENTKHMFKLMGKEIYALLGAKPSLSGPLNIARLSVTLFIRNTGIRVHFVFCQTVKTLMKCCIKWHFIRVWILC